MPNPPTSEHAQLETVRRRLKDSKARNARLKAENEVLIEERDTAKASAAALNDENAALKRSGRESEKQVGKLKQMVKKLRKDEARASTERERDVASRDQAHGSSSRSTTGRRELPSFPVVRPRTTAPSTSTALARPSSFTSVPTPASSSALAITRRQPLEASNAQSSTDVAPPLIDAGLMARAEALLSPEAIKRVVSLIEWHDSAFTDESALEIVGRIAEVFGHGQKPMDAKSWSEQKRLMDERLTLMQEVRSYLKMKRERSAGPSRGRW